MINSGEQTSSVGRGWYHPRSLSSGIVARPRLLLAVVVALLALLVSPAQWPPNARAVFGWDCGAIAYIAAIFHQMATCTQETMRTRAAINDESRYVFFGVILLAISSSVGAIFGLLGEAKAAQGALKSIFVALAGVAILVSWLVMQIAFTLHYAHDYYAPPDGRGRNSGLVFPGDGHPDYWDFFYFTTSIGATSQTSDVAIRSKAVRRMVAFQAVLAFVFNTTVVALAINLAASLG